jgi:hypothetical protein
MMHRRDGGIGAMALGFWREPEHEQPRDEAPASHDQRQDPRAHQVGSRPERRALPSRRRRDVPPCGAEEELRRQAKRNGERDGADARDDTDEGTEHQPLA